MDVTAPRWDMDNELFDANDDEIVRSGDLDEPAIHDSVRFNSSTPSVLF